MLPEINKVKGLHPGIILKREIEERNIKKKELAKSINEYPQTISAIIKQKRGINPKLSIKLARFFNTYPDYFMYLQASHDVLETEKSISKSDTPDISKIRQAVFWDTNIMEIDWQKQKTAVTKRIFERGNEEEIREIIKFYGKNEVKNTISRISKNFLPSFEENIEKYLN
jgi:addiction module HigA family antidote